MFVILVFYVGLFLKLLSVDERVFIGNQKEQ